ncbi:MAG: hypothetical protein HYV02_07025 [Deltaproteobacteria bacterium]|nr:hypothetical protein [Deltaproteobacteria bacterium]
MFPDARLIFILGKGGVGKTVVAAAAALWRARCAEEVLLVEIETQDFGVYFHQTPLSYEGIAVAPHLTVASINAHDAFTEYATGRLGSHALYRTLFDNRFVHYFLDATPGINALMCLGKIWSMTQTSRWDRILVDLPATGHGLGFLRAPWVVTDAVPRGPLYEHGMAIRSTLHDRAQTRALIVTLCEELPVRETLDIAQALRTSVQMALGPVVANRRRPPVIPAAVHNEWGTFRQAHATDPEWRPYLDAATFALRHEARQHQQEQTLAAAFGDQLRFLPELPPSSTGLAGAMAQAMEAWQ